MATAPKTHNKPAAPTKRDWRAYDRQRGTAAQRGYDNHWAKYSIQYRAEHPLCIQCLNQGRTTPVGHVDHIIPVTGPDDPRFWDESNHQPLCRSCHSRKTAQEENGRAIR